MTERTLEVDSIIKTYGFNHLLSDVYLKCKTNEVIGILGRNGAGKSTLLKIIFGSTDADNKNIRFDNKVFDMPFKEGNLVAYLPQNQFLPKNQSVAQIIRIYFSDRNIRKRIFSHNKIKPHLTKKTTALSGGERRYFEVLLLLNLPVSFVLLDEPFSALEPLFKSEIKALINTYRKEKGIILTDHDYVNLMEVSDHLCLIDQGVCRHINDRKQLEEYNYLPPEKSSKYEEEVEPFTADKQTLKDLELNNVHGQNSFFSIFGSPETKGGKAQLEKLFLTPTCHTPTLKNRQETIRFFQEHDEILTINKKQLDFISFYYESSVIISSDTLLDTFLSFVKNKWRESNDYYIKETGIRFVHDFLKDMDQLSTEIQKLTPPSYLSSIAFNIQETINKKNLREFDDGFDQHSYFVPISSYDFLLRKTLKQDIAQLLDIFYQLEAFYTIGKESKHLNFNFPEYTNSLKTHIELEGLIHPKIQNAVANNFYFSEKENICFLTGANMAGKSSFLKAFGIAVYLAHLGFPVPASKMKISQFDGLVTTINLSDDLNLGLSHFYSEVMRVKEVAKQLKNNKRLVVIFDELFRGTNVKDAASASSLIINALAKLQGSTFIISSHILKIAEELETNNNIFFNCFETNLVNNEPKYTYKLKNGVSTESLGINIVLKEQILEILEGKLPSKDKGADNT
ncbi:MutS-related protein [Cyclobacterium amurskyense]|uniref:MutS-related protein n=1 Tax=Cyclobacterium amurskyense TaxID=320787 RepID=UPI0030DB789E